MKNITKFFSVLLVLIILSNVIVVAPISASAAKATSGTTGDVTWSFNENTKTLSFVGEGKVGSYASTEDIPWKDHAKNVNTVYIDSGITDFAPFSLFHCQYIYKFEVDPDNQYYTAIDGQLYSKDTTVLYRSTTWRTGIVKPFVKKIGDYAFYNMDVLYEVIIPDSVEEIGKGAFSCADNLEKVDWSFNCTKISDYCFNDCDKLSEINNLDNVTAIGNYAFNRCQVIENFVIPSNLTELGRGSFKEFYFYNTPVLSEAITTIPAYCFSDCIGTKYLKVYNTITSIGDYAFMGSNINSIIVIDENGETAEDYCTIPSSVKTIGYKAFYDSNVSKVIMSEGLEKIGNSAFESSWLSEAQVPDTIIELGNNVVYDTKFSEKEKNIESGIIYFGKYAAGVVEKYNGEVVFRENTLGMANNLFSKSFYITKITIPATTKYIPNGALPLISPMNEYVVDESNPYFYVENEVLLSKDNTRVLKCPANSSLTEYVLPETVTDVDIGAFYNCVALKTISIPESVTELNSTTFAGCTSLKTVNIPKSVTVIPSQFFSGCTSLESIELPEGLTEIGLMAFANTNLKEISFPTTLVKISSYAFQMCAQLTEVYVPDSVNLIYTRAFNGCTNLQKVVIGTGVSYVYNEVFLNCTALKSVEFKTEQRGINSYAFSGCKALETIKGIDNVTYIGEGAFYYCESLKGYVVPKNITTIYEKTFYKASNITLDATDSKLKYINDYAFYGCIGLNLISFGSNLKTIGAYAFYGCDIEEVTLPNTITTFGKNAFRNCQKLRIINIEEGFPKLSDCCFYNCKALNSIVIPQSIKHIYPKAFAYCTNLKSFYMLNKECSVDTNAFYKCESLTDIYFAASYDELDNTWRHNKHVSAATFHYSYNSKVYIDISDWAVWDIKNKVYTGKPIKQNIVVTDGEDVATVSVNYKNNVKAGKATIIIRGTGDYSGEITRTFKITKAKQPMKVKAINKSVDFTKVEKSNYVVSKVLKVSKNKGDLKFAKTKSFPDKMELNKKTGAITVKKGTLKGVYKVKIKVTAKGNANYKEGSKTVTVKINVK